MHGCVHFRPAITKFTSGLGYLLGPTIGSTLFSLTHPKLSRGSPAPLEVMDREFFNRIHRQRADPSFQSAQNPAPDYYGEKVRCFRDLLRRGTFVSQRRDEADRISSSPIYSYSLFVQSLSSTPTDHLPLNLPTMAARSSGLQPKGDARGRGG